MRTLNHLCLGVVVLTGVSPGAVVLNDGHWDLDFRFNGSWEIVLDDGDGVSADLAPEEVVMVVIDQPFPSEGGRVSRPSGAQWDFLGPGAGEDLWFFPAATSLLLWPGFASEGAFAEYFEPDPRLGFTAAFVKIRLDTVVYTGNGEGDFSIWNTMTGGVPTIWMTTTDGISPDDAYFFSIGHAHANIGFSDLGIYRVDLEASAFLGNDGGNPPAGTNPTTSPIQSFYFAVGTFAEWKAGFYDPTDLVDPSPSDSLPEVAHAHSDTDGDGICLLLEYAFNLSPVVPDSTALEFGTGVAGVPAGEMEDVGGEGRLALEFVRRRAETNPQITYLAEFSSSADSDWAETGTEVVSIIDADWERVRVVDNPPPGEEDVRFGRVRVVLE